MTLHSKVSDATSNLLFYLNPVYIVLRKEAVVSHPVLICNYIFIPLFQLLPVGLEIVAKALVSMRTGLAV